MACLACEQRDREIARLNAQLLAARDPLAEWERGGVDFAQEADIDTGIYRVKRIYGLSRGPAIMLQLMLKHPGKVVAKQRLLQALEHLQGRDVDPKTTDIYIFRIRRALGGGGAIKTVWGVGWYMEPEAVDDVRARLSEVA